MFSETSIGGISYHKCFKSSTFCWTQCLYKNVVISIWHTLEFLFSFVSLYLLEYCKSFMTMNFLVLSYLIVSHKQLLVKCYAMNTEVRCLLGIIKQFLQYFFHSNKIKIINCLIKILSEVHKSQKFQTRIIPPKIMHNLGAVDYFSGNLRFSREYLYR